MVRTYYPNRTNLTFCLTAYGNEGVEIFNKVMHLAKKYNAQINIFDNAPFHKFTQINGVPKAYAQWGSFGGTVTFHADKCDHDKGADDLIALIGQKVTEYIEVVKTHRDDGSPYKVPQYLLEKI
jgi:hypothetical protein